MAGAVASAVAAAGVRRVVLVGPARPELAGLATTLPGGLAVTREDPPGSGPVPALRAGLARRAGTGPLPGGSSRVTARPPGNDSPARLAPVAAGRP